MTRYDELLWQATFVDAEIGAIVELRVVHDSKAGFLGYMPQWRPFGSKRWLNGVRSLAHPRPGMGRLAAWSLVTTWQWDLRSRQWWNNPYHANAMRQYGHQLSLTI